MYCRKWGRLLLYRFSAGRYSWAEQNGAGVVGKYRLSVLKVVEKAVSIGRKLCGPIRSEIWLLGGCFRLITVDTKFLLAPNLQMSIQRDGFLRCRCRRILQTWRLQSYNAPCQRIANRRKWYVVVGCCYRAWCTRCVCSDKSSNNDDRIALKPSRYNGVPASLSNLCSLGSPAIGCILSRSYANFSSCFLTVRYRR